MSSKPNHLKLKRCFLVILTLMLKWAIFHSYISSCNNSILRVIVNNIKFYETCYRKPKVCCITLPYTWFIYIRLRPWTELYKPSYQTFKMPIYSLHICCTIQHVMTLFHHFFLILRMGHHFFSTFNKMSLQIWTYKFLHLYIQVLINVLLFTCCW